MRRYVSPTTDLVSMRSAAALLTTSYIPVGGSGGFDNPDDTPGIPVDDGRGGFDTRREWWSQDWTDD